MTTFDIIVVGSGPSGAMAAYEAAQDGHKVAILEKENLPRYKTCGGGLVHRGRKLLPFDLTSVIEKEFNSVEVHFSDSPYYFDSFREEPIISMVMRDKFDHFLVDKAKARGAVLFEECALETIEYLDTLILSTTKGPMRTRYLIAADGVYSPTAKMVGWKDDRKLIPALEFEVQVPEEDFARLSKTVRFDVDVVPNGYGWCFPKGGHLSIGVGLFQKRRTNLKAHYLEYLRHLGISEIIKEEAHGYQIPTSHRSGALAKKNIFLTGDAAGLADPLTAEGISNAIYSGVLAGRSVREYFDQPNQAMKFYQDQLDKQLLPELKSAQFAADLFYNQKKIRSLLLDKYGQAGCEILVDIFTGQRRYPTRLRKKVLSYVKGVLGEVLW